LADAEIVAKFHDNARRATSAARAEAIAETMLALDAAPDLRAVADRLSLA
jgi:hypothetical protein